MKDCLWEEIFVEKARNLKERAFGLRDKIGYLLGDFGNDFTFILSSTFLLKFYTDVMGVDAFIVGIIMMIARFVDAFTDVTMGRICDRSRVRGSGKFKPWILRMCAPVAISSFLIYQSALRDSPMGLKIAWLFVTYILWGSIFYTSINIPYGSMASAISAIPEDRQSLSTFRTMGGTLAGVIIGGGIPLLAYKKETVGNAIVTVLDGPTFTIIAGVLSILSILAYLGCYFLCTERVISETGGDGRVGSTLSLLKRAFSNRALISIVFASIFMLLSQLTMQGMSNYIFPNYYNNAPAMSASTIAMMVAMLISAAVAKPVSRLIGKAEISAICSLIAAAVSLTLYIIRPANVWIYVLIQFLSWVGLGIFSMVCWALITDVIDYSEIKHGVREDGSIYALYSFSRKLGQAAASGLTGALLTYIGYSDNTAFDTGVLDGIFDIATLVPAIGFALLAIILWFWYPLKRSVVTKNVEILRRRREEQEG